MISRKLVTLFVCIMLIVSGTLPIYAAPVEIKDVPSGHWAYSAVVRLLEKGYLSLYQDRTFRGQEPIDRFTFAVVVARLISEMAANPAPAKAPEVKDEDLEVLRNLSTEFRDELVQLATEDETIRQNLAGASKELTVLREDLNKILVQVYQLQQSTTALAESTDALGARVDDLAAQSNASQASIAEVQETQADFAGQLKALEQKIDDEVLTRASGTYVRQQSMEKDLQKLAQEFDSYRRNSESELESLRSSNQFLKIGIIVSLAASVLIK